MKDWVSHKPDHVCFRTATLKNDASRSWIIDLGASAHITPHNSQLDDSKPLKFPNVIKLGDGWRIVAENYGTINTVGFPKQHAFLVPDLSAPLLSVRMLTNSGAECNVTPSEALIKMNGKMMVMNIMHGLYTVPENISNIDHVHTASFLRSPGYMYELWHKRLGHPCKMQWRSSVIRRNSKSLFARYVKKEIRQDHHLVDHQIFVDLRVLVKK